MRARGRKPALLLIAGAALLPLAAAAQPAAPVPSSVPSPATPPAAAVAAPAAAAVQPIEADALAGAVRASRILGKAVRNEAGEDIGSVKELIVRPNGNALAVLGVGGFLGAGERLVALPLEALHGIEAGEIVLPSVTQQSVKDLPEFKFPTRPAPKESAAKEATEAPPQEPKPAPAQPAQ